MKRSKFCLTMLAVSVFALSACSAPGSGKQVGDSIKVGLVLSYTGVFATQAQDFENGFRAALDELTDGSMEINGKKIEILRGDDTGDPAVGITQATKLIGDGVKVIAGPTNSTIAIAVAELAVQNQVMYLGGTSTTDVLTGMDDLVFSTYGASPGGDMAVAKLVGDAGGENIGVLAQDYAAGQAAVAQVKAGLKDQDVKVSPYLLPQSTTDFTPVSLELRRDRPDFLYTYWAGDGTNQLYSTLGAQGVLEQSQFLGFLFVRSSFSPVAEAFGSSIKDAQFIVPYFQGATGNADEKALIAYSEAHDHVVEYDDALGWNAGEMFYHAASESDSLEPEDMAKQLKDWSFEGPAGEVTIRGEDNQVTVPRFAIRLVKQPDSSWFPELIQELPASEIQAPVVRPIG